MRRAVLQIAFLFVCALSAASVQSAEPKPNILFILVDDQRWDSMGCYGNTGIRTPNFDKLAKDGARLDAFYVACPVCCPSRATFLSGLYPHQTGIYDNSGNPKDLKPETPTVATQLNKAGYLTGLIGKCHLGGNPKHWGFTEFPVYLPGGGSAHEKPTLVVDGKSQKTDGLITNIFADAAIAFLDKNKEKTWFLWLATTAPHGPFLNDPKHVYAAKDIVMPGWPKEESIPAAKLTGYFSTVSMLDEQVGRVLAKLDELKLAGNTFVFLASDNGYCFGSHGCHGKQVWFEESARTSGLVRWPGKIAPGLQVASPISSVDLLPTVVELAGGEKPAVSPGFSMLPALTGGKPLRDALLVECNLQKDEKGVKAGKWQMVRKGDWKYASYMERKEEYLFNLKDDPHELKNLAQSEPPPPELEELRKVLKEQIAVAPQ